MIGLDGEGALFLALLSHDLRNVFAPILAGSRLLSEELSGLGPAAARELAGEIGAQSERGYLLLEELLAWARCRMEAGEGRMAPRRSRAARQRRRPPGPRPPRRREIVELEPLVRGALALYELPAASRGLSLQARVEPGAAALSDRNLASAPLRNLVANAVRLSRPGGAVLVSARIEEAWALLAVEDSGPGLGPGFSLGLPPGSGGRAGSPFDPGLGLFLAREFSELAGGSLDAAPRPDGLEGAVFTLRLPRA